MSSPRYAMLLAAGYGTRLGDLSRQRPKPMLPVCNVPLVRWAASLCLRHGIRDLVVNLHHLGEQIRAELGDGRSLGARITYSPESEILGTGGGIKAMAARMPRGTALVVNAKVIADVDLDAVSALHRRSGARATMVLRPDPEAERWGAIGVDGEGQLVRLLDQRRVGADAGLDCMFTGIHLLEPELIDAIPAGPCCIIRTAYRALFQSGTPLAGYLHRGYFNEHSTPARYLRGNLDLLDGLADPPARPGPLRGVDGSANIAADATLKEPLLVGPGACIEAGAVVGPRAVIGAGSRIPAGVRVAESVVWPGSVVQRDSQRAIVTPTGAVVEEER